MRLPSASDWVCSVITVAQNGAPFTGAASMLSKRMVTMPALACSVAPEAPPFSINAGSVATWAVAVAAAKTIKHRARTSIFQRMLCFLQFRIANSKLNFFEPNAASDSVRTNQHVRGYGTARPQEARGIPRHDRRRQLNADHVHTSGTTQLVAVHQAAESIRKRPARALAFRMSVRRRMTHVLGGCHAPLGSAQGSGNLLLG